MCTCETVDLVDLARSFKMASVATSPVKYAPSDWHTSNKVLHSSAERQREMSNRVRQESHKTRNETGSQMIVPTYQGLFIFNFLSQMLQTKWTQHDSDTHLHNRHSDVTDWKNTVDTTFTKTEREMEQLLQTKRIAEYSLQSMSMPLEIALECLTTREGRIAIDLVRDDVEAELNKVINYALHVVCFG